MDDSNEQVPTPSNVKKIAAIVRQELLPKKSIDKCDGAYKLFREYQKTLGDVDSSEDIMLIYFRDLMKIWKPTTIWSHYSMLETTIQINHNIDIGFYHALVQLIKKNSKGFQSKKANTLTTEQLEKFLTTASDEIYLATKVIIIFGICGACRGAELTYLKVQDVIDQKNVVLVKIPNTKNYIPRTLTIDYKFYSIIKKYENLRPKESGTDRYFLNYHSGKCTKQPIGKNKIARIPYDIAMYLKLNDPKTYTGHSFRRTSATLLANSGADLLTIKKHGGWNSSTVAEGYIDNSMYLKQKTAKIFADSINVPIDHTDDIPEKENLADSLDVSMNMDDTNNIREKEKPIDVSIEDILTSNNENVENNKVDDQMLEEIEVDTVPQNKILQRNIPPNIILKNCTNFNIKLE